MKKIVVVVSTSGSVLSKVLGLDEVHQSIYMVVSDRICGAIETAKKYGIRMVVLTSASGKEFSDKLIEFFKDDNVDVFLSFYTRLFTSDFINKFPYKVYNFHPSILPACPGMDGFGDTIKSGSKFFGSTLHLVDEGVDTGKPLIQSVYPFNPTISVEENRHILFIQQCKIFIQFVIWLKQGRIEKDTVKDSKSFFEEFSPNLEHSIAKDFTVNFQ